MALLAASRRETEAPSLPILAFLFVPLVAVWLDSFLPVHFAPLGILELPLLVVIYFAIVRRSAITGTFAGAIIGILQDSLTGQPLGVFGITETIIGYIAGLLGNRIDTDNYIARFLFTSSLVFLHSGLYWLLVKRFLNQPVYWSWVHEPVRALVNGVLAVILFAFLDLLRRSYE